MTAKLWQHASKMLNDIKERVNVVTDDATYYEIRLTKSGAIVGTLNKTYLDHEKVFRYKLRSTSGYLTDSMDEDEAIVRLTQLKQDILTDAMILEVEQL